MSLSVIRKELHKLKDPTQGRELQRYFKTGPGEYGEGDIFLGIKVPILRKLAYRFRDVALSDIKELLHSPIHEERFISLVLLKQSFAKANEQEKERIYTFYLENIDHINNWDLVDSSAEHIVGAFLNNKSKAPLYILASSKKIWKRRIAMMSTFHFIKQNGFDETLRIAKILLADEEDLIHKAVGWMLREIGKRDLSMEEGFLKEHYKNMPRVMLRYAIEKFPEIKRQKYLKGEI